MSTMRHLGDNDDFKLHKLHTEAEETPARPEVVSELQLGRSN